LALGGVDGLVHWRFDLSKENEEGTRESLDAQDVVAVCRDVDAVNDLVRVDLVQVDLDTGFLVLHGLLGCLWQVLRACT